MSINWSKSLLYCPDRLETTKIIIPDGYMWDAKMADEENIRHCVRDKFEQRMRNLIRSTAASITRDLDQNLGGGLLPSRSRSCILVVCSTSKSATFSGALSGIGSGSSSLGVTKGSSPVPGHS